MLRDLFSYLHSFRHSGPSAGLAQGAELTKSPCCNVPLNMDPHPVSDFPSPALELSSAHLLLWDCELTLCLFVVGKGVECHRCQLS